MQRLLKLSVVWYMFQISLFIAKKGVESRTSEKEFEKVRVNRGSSYRRVRKWAEGKSKNNPVRGLTDGSSYQHCAHSHQSRASEKRVKHDFPVFHSKSAKWFLFSRHILQNVNLHLWSKSLNVMIVFCRFKVKLNVCCCSPTKLKKKQTLDPLEGKMFLSWEI